MGVKLMSHHDYQQNPAYKLNSINIIENMNEVLYTYDLEGRVTYVNKKAFDVIGYTPDEIIGKFLWEFVAGRYRDNFRTILKERTKSNGIGIYIITVIHKDGSERIIRLNASPIIEDGITIGEMGLAEDITKQRKAEKELKKYYIELAALSQELRAANEQLSAANEQLMATEEELRQQLDESEKNKDALADAHQSLEVLLDFLPDPTFAIDLTGNITMWNRAMEELTGLKAREMLGKGNYEYTIPFYGNRRPITVNLALPDNEPAKGYYKNAVFHNDTIFTEEFCPQLGVNGAYLASKASILLDRKGNKIGAIQTLRNVSEQKAQEAALLESEEKYRNIIQSLDDGYFEVDLAGNFIFFNKALHQSVGYSAQEMMGLNYRFVMDQENADKVLRAFNRVYTTGKPIKEFGWYVVRKDSSKLFVESTILPILENNEIIGFRGLIRDITERKKTEEALQASERQLNEQVKYLNTLIDNLNEIFVTYDVAGKITFANKRTYTILGYKPEEAIGQLVVDFIVEEDKEFVAKNIYNRLKNGESSSYETRIAHRKVGNILVKLNASPIINENGLVIGGMILAEDITERKIAEEQLKFSEARYRAIVEDQTELIARSLPDGTITFVNEAYCRYFNLERDLIYGMNFLDNVYEPDQELVLRCVNSLNIKSPVKALESRVKMSDGTIRWLNWTHRAIYDDDDNLIDYQSVGSDVTERKLAEDRLNYLSKHDILTGIYNRAYFEEKMKVFEETYCTPISLIMCDVDGLKLINDTLGHDEGDELLRSVAQVLSNSFRKNDIVARVGGDEFAILLPGSKQRVTESAVNRIKENIKLYNMSNPKVPLSLSIGCAIRNDLNISMLELYQEADNNMYREKLHSGQSARSSIVQTLMKALEARDFITEGHGDRMQSLIVKMAKSLKLSNQKINELKLFAQFHDIGKVGIPDNILFKEGPLTSEEYAIMKRHSEIGHRIALSAPELVHIADWILKHHEWWNGEGYPLGIKETGIPVECRVLAIVDAYDSMTNDRPYREAMTHKEAVKELKRNAGKQFDPLLVEKFLAMIQEEVN